MGRWAVAVLAAALIAAAPAGAKTLRFVTAFDRNALDPHALVLLQEAGYPDGFGVTLDCVKVTFRAALCQVAADGR